MIAVSGAFVVLALVLLIIGLATSGLTVVYASILASIVSAAFLIAGVLQLHRRDEGALPGAGPRAARRRRSPGRDPEEDADGPVRSPVAPPPSDGDRGPTAAGTGPLPATAAGTGTAGIVFVSPGSTDYHTAECPRLGSDPEPLEVEDARDTGYRACPACRPDDHLLDLAELLSTGSLPGPWDGTEVAPEADPPPGPAGTDRVLALSAQGRYHLPGCNYLPPGATRVTTRAAAEAEGLQACGLCSG